LVQRLLLSSLTSKCLLPHTGQKLNFSKGCMVMDL
jgi:hypothetical protein